MITRALAFITLISAATAALLPAQTVEILFTQGGMSQALGIKKVLKVDKAEAFAATALLNASAARKQAYVTKVASNTAVLIVGEDALKATSDVAFTVPVVIVNATGPSAATSSVVRIFDATFAGTPPASAKTVTSPDGVAGLIGQGKEVALKCEGVPAGAVIQALLGSLK